MQEVVNYLESLRHLERKKSGAGVYGSVFCESSLWKLYERMVTRGRRRIAFVAKHRRESLAKTREQSLVGDHPDRLASQHAWARA
jgi:hypothetical protein